MSLPPKRSKPMLPEGPQIAEALDLLATLEDIRDYLKSTDPRSESARKSQLLTQKLGHKLKHTRQQVQKGGSPAAKKAFATPRTSSPAEDLRHPEHIQVLTRDLPPETKGPEVQCLQALLNKEGVKTPQHGHWDRESQQALRQWQRQQNLPLSGKLDDRSRPILNQRLQYWRQIDRVSQRCKAIIEDFETQWHSLCGKPFAENHGQTLHSRLVEQLKHLSNSPAPSALEALAPDPPISQQGFTQLMGTPGLAHVTHQGPEVEALQQFLKTTRHPTPVTRQFNLDTFMALKGFQAEHHLPPSGYTDPDTLRVLNDYVSRSRWQYQFALALYHCLSEGLKTMQGPPGARTIASSSRQASVEIKPELARLWKQLQPEVI